MFSCYEVHYLFVRITEGAEDTENAENALVSPILPLAKGVTVTNNLSIPRHPRSPRLP